MNESLTTWSKTAKLPAPDHDDSHILRGLE
ncbi:hypothetical protein JOD27_005987 [Lentzea nigeriaca]|nr:hypothetical protein [Lentzea nigeriaca]